MIDLMKDALENIIRHKRIRTVFQPIVSLRDGSILGHEALSRITGESPIQDPGMLFTLAGKYNCLWDLELLCRTTALEAAFIFMIPPYSKKLFLNVNPNIMHDEKFKMGFTRGFLKQYKIQPDNVIFEITERYVINDMSGFRSTIQHYRSQDYRIAIDDAGAGYSGLNLISDINPNYIKLDMQLIRGIDTDSLKFALVKGMVELSNISKIHLIAEGIETYEEMETLVNLGVQYGQGYYIQKPETDVHELSPDFLAALQEINLKRNHLTQNIASNIFIKNLCSPTGILAPTEMVPQVYDSFKRSPNCFGLCVIENHVPVGIVTRDKLALKLSGQYGFALYQNKPIVQIMDRDFLSVDYKTSVSVVSLMAMSRSYDKLYDFIVVTENDRFIGTVTIKDLLQKTTEIEISAAKHQNPLTGLPGNMIIEQRLSHCVSNVSKYSIAYLDIDNFKAYNDVYGFENGDLVINLLADSLRSRFSDNQFIGHIGGDDFVVIVYDHVVRSHFDELVRQFEREVRDLYRLDDLKNGYITSSNRHGEVEQVPLISLTTVVVNNQAGTFSSVSELTETLAALKKIAKQRAISGESAVLPASAKMN